MAGGRPTKLTKELLAKAESYDFAAQKHAVPTIEGLALFIDVDRSTIYDWAEKGKAKDATLLQQRFSNIVSRNLEIQALELVNNGLKGRFNAKIANMMLSKHGYVEKQQTDLTTNGKDLPTPILGGAAKGGENV